MIQADYRYLHALTPSQGDTPGRANPSVRPGTYLRIGDSLHSRGDVELGIVFLVGYLAFWALVFYVAFGGGER